MTGVDPAWQPMEDGVRDFRNFVACVLLGLVVAVVAFFKSEPTVAKVGGNGVAIDDSAQRVRRDSVDVSTV
ncbi:MAG: hypothetical protein ACHREM_08190 [Polyangiales bacterium]